MDVKVMNAPGIDYDSTVPDGYESWIDYWEKLRFPGEIKHAKWCRYCKKEKKDIKSKHIVGGHVELCMKHKDGKWYPNKEKGIFITPLCPECNNSNNNNNYPVNELDLIEIPLEENYNMDESII